MLYGISMEEFAHDRFAMVAHIQFFFISKFMKCPFHQVCNIPISNLPVVAVNGLPPLLSKIIAIGIR